MQLPTSGVVLGHVVRAFELTRTGAPGASRLKERTNQRYFEGKEGPSFEARSGAIRTVVDCLVADGLVPERINAFVTEGTAPAAALAQAWEECLRNWDGVVGELGSGPIRVEDERAAAVCALELLLADFSVRWAALCLLEDRAAPAEEGTPLWARDHAQRDYLRHLLKRAAVTRDALVEAVDASFSTVDAWLDGVNRPGHAAVEAIAQVLASPLRMEAPAIARDLRRHLALIELARNLGAVVGSQELERLTAALVRLTRRAYDALLRLPSSLRYAELIATFSGGLIAVHDDILVAIRDGEEDEDVAHAVELAQHHLSIALYLRWTAVASGEHVRRVRHRGLELASVRQDHREALAILNSLLAKDSLDFDLLMFRAATYQDLGDHDLALKDAHLAAVVHPCEEAYIFVAATLSLADRDAEGLAYLQEKIRSLPAPSFRAHHQVGCLHYELGEFPAAVRAFERVLELKPDHAHAANFLSIAAERSGASRRADSAAKTARHLGHSMAQQWRAEFRKRKKRR